MSLRGLTNINVCKEKYNQLFPERISKKIERRLFEEFIDNNKSIFSWMEETSLGQKTLKTIDTFEDKERILKLLNKKTAFAFFKEGKGYYGLDVSLNESFGYIVINFNNTRVTIEALNILLEMAKYCNAMLLVNGKKEITKEFIEKEKREIEEKMRVKN